MSIGNLQYPQKSISVGGDAHIAPQANYKWGSLIPIPKTKADKSNGINT